MTQYIELDEAAAALVETPHDAGPRSTPDAVVAPRMDLVTLDEAEAPARLRTTFPATLSPRLHNYDLAETLHALHESAVPSEREIERRVSQVVEKMMRDWQRKLPDVAVTLGGSLASDLFIYDGAKTIDADVRFLVTEPSMEVARRIERVTGLKYRKTVKVGDWPSGQSTGYLIESIISVPGIPIPLEIEGLVRNTKYVGWARLYRRVLSPEEIQKIRQDKVRLRGDKAAYKSLKAAWRDEVERRASARGLVKTYEGAEDPAALEEATPPPGFPPPGSRIRIKEPDGFSQAGFRDPSVRNPAEDAEVKGYRKTKSGVKVELYRLLGGRRGYGWYGVRLGSPPKWPAGWKVTVLSKHNESAPATPLPEATKQQVDASPQFVATVNDIVQQATIGLGKSTRERDRADPSQRDVAEAQAAMYLVILTYAMDLFGLARAGATHARKADRQQALRRYISSETAARYVQDPRILRSVQTAMRHAPETGDASALAAVTRALSVIQHAAKGEVKSAHRRGMRESVEALDGTISIDEAATLVESAQALIQASAGAVKALTKHASDLKQRLTTAKRDLTGLRTAGAGETEARTLLARAIAPIDGMAKVVDQWLARCQKALRERSDPAVVAAAMIDSHAKVLQAVDRHVQSVAREVQQATRDATGLRRAGAGGTEDKALLRRVADEMRKFQATLASLQKAVKGVVRESAPSKMSGKGSRGARIAKMLLDRSERLHHTGKDTRHANLFYRAVLRPIAAGERGGSWGSSEPRAKEARADFVDCFGMSEEQLRRKFGPDYIAPGPNESSQTVDEAGKALFQCMECGRKFKTTAAAQRATSQGCPGCGGSDIDLAESLVEGEIEERATSPVVAYCDCGKKVQIQRNKVSRDPRFWWECPECRDARVQGNIRRVGTRRLARVGEAEEIEESSGLKFTRQRIKLAMRPGESVRDSIDAHVADGLAYHKALSKRGWTVTHVPTGRAVTTARRPLPSAKVAQELIAKLLGVGDWAGAKTKKAVMQMGPRVVPILRSFGQIS